MIKIMKKPKKNKYINSFSHKIKSKQGAYWSSAIIDEVKAILERFIMKSVNLAST